MGVTNLSRRRFFGLLGGAAAVHFLPPLGGWTRSPGEALYSLPGEYCFAIGSLEPQFLYWAQDVFYKDSPFLQHLRESPALPLDGGKEIHVPFTIKA